MTGTFGRDHEYVDIGRRLNLSKVNVKPVGKGKGRTGTEVGGDLFAVGRGLLFIRDQHHDNVGPRSCFRNAGDFEAGGFGFGPGFASSIESDSDIDAAFLQIERMRMTLASIADNSYFAVQHEIPVCILIII